MGRSAGRQIAGDSSWRLAAPPADHITDREWQVIACVALGLSNRETGGDLGIAEQTVKNHVRSALLKAGKSNRTELALWALSAQARRLAKQRLRNPRFADPQFLGSDSRYDRDEIGLPICPSAHLPPRPPRKAA